MFTKPFWSDLLERAVRAAAWAALALLGADQSGVIHHVDLAAVGTVAGYAALASVLASLAGSQVGAKDSGSFLPADVDPPQATDAGLTALGVVLAVLVVILAFSLFGALHSPLFLLLLILCLVVLL